MTCGMVGNIILGKLSMALCKIGFHTYRVVNFSVYNMDSALYECERCGKKKRKPIW